MGICAWFISASKYLRVTTASLNAGTGTCADGVVLMDKVDFAANNMLSLLVAVPSAGDFSLMWAAGFITPMSIGLVGWCVRRVVFRWS